MTMGMVNRLMLWLAGVSGAVQLIGLGLCGWLIQHRQHGLDPLLPKGSALLQTYNALAHQHWLAVMLTLIDNPPPLCNRRPDEVASASSVICDGSTRY